MIIDLEVRNGTGYPLEYRIVNYETLPVDRTITVLPGMVTTAELLSGFSELDGREELTLMNNYPNSFVDSQSARATGAVNANGRIKSRFNDLMRDITPSSTGIIPCETSSSILLKDINQRILFHVVVRAHQVRGSMYDKFYIGELRVNRLKEYKVWVGLISVQNTYQDARANGQDYDALNNALVADMATSGIQGYLEFRDCYGNQYSATARDFREFGLQRVPREVYRQFLADTRFSMNKYNNTRRSCATDDSTSYFASKESFETPVILSKQKCAAANFAKNPYNSPYDIVSTKDNRISSAAPLYSNYSNDYDAQNYESPGQRVKWDPAAKYFTANIGGKTLTAPPDWQHDNGASRYCGTPLGSKELCDAREFSYFGKASDANRLELKQGMKGSKKDKCTFM